MQEAIIQFLLSATVIIISGSFLTHFAEKIAEVTGWGRMFVGGLLLAGATSLPELMVDIKAIEMGLPDLAVGDLLGSSLMNLLILALLDFFFPSAFRRTAFSTEYLHHSLAASLTIILTAIVGFALVTRLESTFFNVSVFTWLIVIVYFFGLRFIFAEGKERDALKASTDSTKIESSHETTPTIAPIYFLKNKPTFIAFFGYFFSASIILFAAPYLVTAADTIAKQSGLGHTFVGTTMVALATSLPELVATFVAFRMGSPELALGNIFGSNAFNMVLFWPLDFLNPGSIFSSARISHVATCFAVIVATGFAIIGQLYRKKGHERMKEPSSEIIVIVILAFLYLIYRL